MNDNIFGLEFVYLHADEDECQSKIVNLLHGLIFKFHSINEHY